MGISTLAVGRGPSTGLSTFMRQQARSLVDTPWQIIQVRFCNLDECGGRWACFSSMLLSPHCFTTAQAIILFIKCRHEIFIFILHFSLLRQMIQVHSKCGHQWEQISMPSKSMYQGFSMSTATPQRKELVQVSHASPHTSIASIKHAKQVLHH